jgi:DNA-directed RNA polymerase specialized sigma24 family protein
VTAERIGTVFAIIGATAAQGTAAVSFADAAADPATLGLRRAFHSALAMRLRMLKAKLRMAVMQHDLLGLGGTNIAAMVQRDGRLLRAHRERPRCRRAQPRDEISPSHSIT